MAGFRVTHPSSFLPGYYFYYSMGNRPFLSTLLLRRFTNCIWSRVWCSGRWRYKTAAAEVQGHPGLQWDCLKPTKEINISSISVHGLFHSASWFPVEGKANWLSDCCSSSFCCKVQGAQCLKKPFELMGILWVSKSVLNPPTLLFFFLNLPICLFPSFSSTLICFQCSKTACFI